MFTTWHKNSFETLWNLQSYGAWTDTNHSTRLSTIPLLRYDACFLTLILSRLLLLLLILWSNRSAGIWCCNRDLVLRCVTAKNTQRLGTRRRSAGNFWICSSFTARLFPNLRRPRLHRSRIHDPFTLGALARAPSPLSFFLLQLQQPLRLSFVLVLFSVFFFFFFLSSAISRLRCARNEF